MTHVIYILCNDYNIRMCVRLSVNIDDHFRTRSKFITFQNQMVDIYYYYLLLYRMLNVFDNYSNFKNRHKHLYKNMYLDKTYAVEGFSFFFKSLVIILQISNTHACTPLTI